MRQPHRGEADRGVASSANAVAPDLSSAGSENSDQVLSGNSDHLSVALPGQTIEFRRGKG